MIDFVVMWVDGSDKEWQALKNSFSPIKKNSDAQYRECGLLKYWFRSIEKYAPWVDRIFFVTCGQKPEWLNADNPKLKLVNHTDFMDPRYLPTFSSHSIELNLHRIPDLSEKFVYFNDDMYLGAPVKETDFFVNDLPCFTPILSVLSPSVPNDPFIHYLCNDTAFVNAHFSKRQVIKNNLFKWYNPKYGKSNLKNIYYGPTKAFSGFTNYHSPSSMLKSVYEKVWELEPELLDKTCLNKFRALTDVNQYVMSYYSVCTGQFAPRSPKSSKFYTIGVDSNSILDAFKNQKYKMICVNDNPNDIDFDKECARIQEIMESVFPEKSQFEI